jgi:cytochrome P450
MSNDFLPVGAPVHRRILSRLETAMVARRNVLEIIPALSYRQPIVSGEMVMRWHMLADPAGMKQVMLDNLSNYPKSEIMKRMLRPAIGESLFNADGSNWKWQRQAVAPVFTHRNVLALAPAMTATAQRTCDRLARGGRQELVTEMLTATFDVICDVALSGREHFDSDTFGQAITEYFRTAGRASLLDFLAVPEWFPRPSRLTGVALGAGDAFDGRRRHRSAPPRCQSARRRSAGAHAGRAGSQKPAIASAPKT